jgi:hypothetical protein
MMVSLEWKVAVRAIATHCRWPPDMLRMVLRRLNNFTEPILQFLEEAWKDFGDLTGRYYGLITE